jgi:uncharacterized protein (UPF0276 family)
MSTGAQVGVGLRPPHYAGVLEAPPALDSFEVISENFLGLRTGGGGRPVEVLERVRAQCPVRLHGVSMNLGSVDPLSELYLARLKALVDRIGPECVSDHVCWTGEGGENLHDLLPLPWTEEALDHLVPRVHHVQERLGRRLVLENPSSYVGYLHSTMTEWEFLGELARRTGAGLLLDVNNVFVTARNHGFVPTCYLDGLPEAAVAQFHLSGHDDSGPLRIDTHDRQVCSDVWELFRHAVRRFGPRPTIVEWDDRLPPFAVLLEEAGRARAILEENSDAVLAVAG